MTLWRVFISWLNSRPGQEDTSICCIMDLIHDVGFTGSVERLSIQGEANNAGDAGLQEYLTQL